MPSAAARMILMVFGATLSVLKKMESTATSAFSSSSKGALTLVYSLKVK